MKKTNIKYWLMAAAAASMLCGCQKSPENSIVKNKDLDAMINQAQDTGAGNADVSQVVPDYENYETVLSDETLGVVANVNAKVDIPQTSKMSVLRVKQKKISQSMLDAVVAQFMPDKQLYDGSAIESKTKKSIELEIQSLKNEVENIKNNQEYSEEEKDQLINEYQEEIDSMQAVYETAADTVAMENYVSDGQIVSVSDLYQQKNNDYYNWAYSMNQDGEMYYGISDSEDGMYRSVYVQNNDNFGNCIRYRSSRKNYIWVSSAVTHGTISSEMWEDSSDVNTILGSYMDSAGDVVECDAKPQTMTEEQAKAIASDFLDKLGLTDFVCTESGLYGEMVDIRLDSDEDYRYTYFLRYLRAIDGAAMNYDIAAKHDEGWGEDSYVKKDWPCECIEFRINDDGIVGFDYNAPLEIVETVVDAAGMKDFDTIKQTFENMILVTNARNDEDLSVTVDVDRVVLGYVLVSEQDSYDTGLLVPVWDFMGYQYLTGSSERDYYKSVLAINAIDGTIIDRSQGY